MLVSHLTRDNARLASENKLLREAIENFRSKKFGKSSEKMSSDQLALFAGLVDEGEDDEEAETTVVAGHTRKKRGRKPAREPFSPDLPREEIPVELEGKDRVCPCCDEEMPRIGVRTTERGEMIPAHIRVKRYMRGVYACPTGNYAKTAPVPPAIYDKAKYEPGVFAHLITAKFADHQPLHRLEGIFKRQGFRIPSSTMGDMIERAGELLEPIQRQMLQEICASHVTASDDTPITVLSPRKKGSRKGFIWSYLAGEKAAFVFSAGRGSAEPERILKNKIGGVLLSDGFEGFDRVCRKNGILRGGCWAHARRKFKDALGSSKVDAAAMMLLIGRLFRIEAALKKRVESPEKLRGEEPRNLIVRIRDRRSRKTIDRIEKLADKITAEGRCLPKSALGKAIGYLGNQWSRLVCFLEEPELKIHNNDCERSIRAVALGRKNWMFAGSQRGASTAATLYSLVCSCKLLDINPEEYLADVLTAISVETDPANLTPWGWRDMKKSAAAKRP